MAKPPPNGGGWDQFDKLLLINHSSPSQWQSPYSLKPQNPQSNLTASYWTQAQAGLPGQHNLAPRYMYVNQYINFPQYQGNGIPTERGTNEHSDNINPYQNLNNNIARVHGSNSHPTPPVDGHQSSLQNNDFSPASGDRLNPSDDAPCAPMGPLAPPVNKRVTSSQKNQNTPSRPRTNSPMENPDDIYYTLTPKPQKKRGRPRKEVSTQKAASKVKKPQVLRGRKSGSGSRPVSSLPPNRPRESTANPIEIHSPEQDSQVVLRNQTHRFWPPSFAPNAAGPSHPVLLPGRRPISHENRPQNSLVARNCHSQLSTHLPQATRYTQAPIPNSCPQATQGSWDAHLQQSSSNLGLVKSPPRLVLQAPDRQQCPQIAMNNPAQRDANPHYQYPSQAPRITRGSIYASSHQAPLLEGPGELSIHPKIYVPNAQLCLETPRTDLDPYPRKLQVQQQHQFHNYLNLQTPPQISPGISQRMNLDGMPSPAFSHINQWLSSTQPIYPPFIMETGTSPTRPETKTPISTYSSGSIAGSSNPAQLVEGAASSTRSPDVETTHTKPDEQEQVPPVKDWPNIIYPSISMFLGFNRELDKSAQDPPEELGPELPRKSPAEDIDDLIPEDDSWLENTEEVEKIVNEWLDVWDSEGLLNRDFL